MIFVQDRNRWWAVVSCVVSVVGCCELCGKCVSDTSVMGCGDRGTGRGSLLAIFFVNLR